MVIQPQAQVLIQTDASKKRLGGCLSRDQNRESVVQEQTGSTYKSTGTFSHEIWHLDICQNVENVSYEYPGRQHDNLDLFAENGRDKESRTNADLKRNLGVSAWAGDHDYCRTFTRKFQLQGRFGISATERFLRMKTVLQRLSNQLPSYYTWKPDPDSLGTDALQQKWYHKSLYAFPPFALIHKVLKKVKEEKVPSLIIVTPTWETQSWYPELLRLSVRNPIILPLKRDLIKGPQKQQHPLIQNRTMQLAVWLVSGSVWQRNEYQKGLQTLFSHQEDEVLSQLTHRPGISGLASVLNKTLIQFDVM